jgi:hypothetical protein
MRRLTPVIGLVVLVISGVAAAADAPATATPPGPAPTSTAAAVPAPASSGLAVVALPGATEVAWPLAQAVYGDPSVRAWSIDETHARALCGEAPPPGAAADVKDLSETVAALRGDDAPTRALLDGIARRLGVRGLVVVAIDPAHGAPSARVFLEETGAFDAATYAPDEPTSPGPASAADAGAATTSWAAATQSLVRAFGRPPAAVPQVSAPALATHDGPTPPASSRQFYESAWFWGALGVAALIGGSVFFATRDSGTPTIHLEAQVPH